METKLSVKEEKVKIKVEKDAEKEPNIKLETEKIDSRKLTVSFNFNPKIYKVKIKFLSTYLNILRTMHKFSQILFKFYFLIMRYHLRKKPLKHLSLKKLMH